MAERETAPHAEAMVALIAERYGQLVGYASKLLRRFDVPPSWVDAEDVVQSALASVLARTEPVEELRPYVFTVIKNEVRHAAQRYRAGLGYGTKDRDLQLEAAGPAIDPCGATDLRLHLQDALSALPRQQRTALFCTKVLGLTQAETAQVMGKNPGTVATHVSRAVVALRTALAVLAVVLGCAVQWLRSGTLPTAPAAGVEVAKDLLAQAAQWWWIVLPLAAVLGVARRAAQEPSVLARRKKRAEKERLRSLARRRKRAEEERLRRRASFD